LCGGKIVTLRLLLLWVAFLCKASFCAGCRATIYLFDVQMKALVEILRAIPRRIHCWTRGVPAVADLAAISPSKLSTAAELHNIAFQKRHVPWWAAACISRAFGEEPAGKASSIRRVSNKPACSDVVFAKHTRLLPVTYHNSTSPPPNAFRVHCSDCPIALSLAFYSTNTSSSFI